MAVGLTPADTLLPVTGIRLSCISAGIYRHKRDDLVLIQFPPDSGVSAVFTKNAFAAAPVIIARRHLENAKAHEYCLINAGNANAGMGVRGEQDALETCRHLADVSGCPGQSIIPFSTGVIGMELPVEKIKMAMPSLFDSLSESKWDSCARAIMTTDTVPKAMSRRIMLDGRAVTVTGMAKGSGMIRPNMATMLAFIATDAAIDKELVDRILTESVESSFNRICVDGDMSTNDACILIATGKSGNRRITDPEDENFRILKEAIQAVCAYLAKSIVRDGEGASKFISIQVSGGLDRQECLRVAYAVACSPLVKTAFFASDPNWGRILAAIGYAGLEQLDISKVNIYINNDVCIVRNGSRAAEYTEQAGKQAMAKEEIEITIELNRGADMETVWTCDLSYDYVRINAEYRS